MYLTFRELMKKLLGFRVCAVIIYKPNSQKSETSKNSTFWYSEIKWLDYAWTTIEKDYYILT
jgi:hypothetical protein